MAKPVMTEACAQAANRMVAFQKSLVKKGVAPATISELMSSGVIVGKKRPIWSKLLLATTVVLPNSMLFSSGMIAANILSAGMQQILRTGRQTIKGTATAATTGDFTDLASHWRSLLGTLAGGGQRAIVYRDAASFMWSTFMEGKASDLHFSVEAIAREQGLKKSEVILRAKNVLWERFKAQNNLTADSPDIDNIEKAFKESFRGDESIEIDRAAQDLFSTTYDYSPKHAIFHDPGRDGKINTVAKAIDFALTTPSRVAIGVDETAKVFFRHQILSEQLYADAMKAHKADPSRSVGDYYQSYMQEVYGAYKNAYKSVPLGSFKNRYHNITRGLKALEGAYDSLFLDKGTTFNDIREQALQMTFQRQTAGFKKDDQGNYVFDDTGSYIRQPSLVDKIARSKTKIGPQYSVGEQALAVFASGTMPFVKTPYNIMVEGLSYTPLATAALATKELRKQAKMRGYDTSDLLARQVIGFTIISSMLSWMMEDDGTGLPRMSGVPVSREERERWKLAGIPEQSIRVGDVWIPYGRIEPVATLLAGLANARYYAVQGDETEFFDYFISTIWNLTADKQAVAGALDFLDHFDSGSPSESMEAMATDYVKKFIPTVSSDIARINDQDRLALEASDKIKQRIPGMRQELPFDYLSIKGADTEQNWAEIFSKVRVPKADWTGLQEEVYRLNVDISKPDRVLAGVELNAQELSLYRKVSQEAVTDVLSRYITSDEYKSLAMYPKEQKENLETLANKVRSQLLPLYMREASKSENFGPTYVGGFAARKRNVEVKRRGLEKRMGVLEEPEYAPTK